MDKDNDCSCVFQTALSDITLLKITDCNYREKYKK